MIGLTEGVRGKTRYLCPALGAFVFAVLIFVQLQGPAEGLVMGTINLDALTVRGIVLPLQMLVSIYLVLTGYKAGFILSIILNAAGLFASAAYLLKGDYLIDLPGMISYTAALTFILLIKGFQDRISGYIKKISTLEKRENYFSQVFNQAPIGLAIVRDKTFFQLDEGDNIGINAGFAQILGRDKDELLDVNWMTLSHPDDLDADLQLFEQFKSGRIKHYANSKRFLRKDGSYVWVDMHISPVTDKGGKPDDYLCIITDITEQKNLEETLKYNSEHVLLTGLSNREALERLLETDALIDLAAPEEKRYLLCINLSGINVLSGRYGFHYKQRLIRKVSDALKAFSSDTCLLFHSYENRFVFYIKGNESNQALSALNQEIPKALQTLLGAYGISYGIGILEVNSENMGDADELLKKLLNTSEMAIRNAGSSTRIMFWSPEMDKLITRENDISQELVEIVSGIKEDRFFMQFQPIWDVSSGKVYALEALARLESEKYGAIPPDEFISLAEKTNMIVPLGEIILYHVFQFLKQLKEKGHDGIAISINISVIQLLKEGFAENLIKQINELELKPENVFVELTESIFAQVREEIKHVIDILKASGIKIMIDDFGTGYSSFERQSELAVDCLKIDKSFIDQLFVSLPEDTIIVDMISMAHKLGHYVVAEGVEHDRQFSYLLGCGCEKIQGYLISKPLDEEEVLAFLQHEKDLETTKNSMKEEMLIQQPQTLEMAD